MTAPAALGGPWLVDWEGNRSAHAFVSPSVTAVPQV
jgi:hypothetical protein